MIRFIDLRGQAVGGRFAFFSTTVDRFISIDDTQVWSTAEEFVESFDAEAKQNPGSRLEVDRQRYLGFLEAHPWTSEPPTFEECFE